MVAHVYVTPNVISAGPKVCVEPDVQLDAVLERLQPGGKKQFKISLDGLQLGSRPVDRP